MDNKQIKRELIKKTSKNPEKYYPVKILKAEGFARAKCLKCGIFYWSTVKRKTCGETDCIGGYTFFGKKLKRKPADFVGIWKEFSRFFKKRGYAPIGRYPVVAKWHPDLFFNIASIVNFQPFVVTGEVNPPANPLVIPQNCIRFNDIDNVGITGRHYSSFTMIGQHAFFTSKKFDQNKYFKDLLDWYIEGLGIPKDELQLHEDAWVGGGNFGPSIEFFYGGLELSNQVYHLYQQTRKGSTELKLKVLDMGAGQERYAWVTNSRKSCYEVNMPTVCECLYRKTKVKPDGGLLLKFFPYSGMLNTDEVDNPEKVWSKIARKVGVSKDKLKEHVLPLAALYSIADHTRTLLYAIGDGALPSNTSGGYNLRVVLRRCLGFIESYGWKIDLRDLIKLHAEYLKPMYPELSKKVKDVNKIIGVEIEKYAAAKESVKNFVKSLSGKKISEKKLLELYDSKGITPQFLLQEGNKYGIRVEIPADFYAKVAARHDKHKNLEAHEEKEVPNVAITQPLYYFDERAAEFEAKVLKIINKRYVILNETLFYSTGGGQAHDTGTLNGARVVDVQKWGKHIVHEVEGIDFKEGDIVIGRIDWDRRWKLMKHHTGTHIVGGSARKVLGSHIWQTGSDVKPEKARLDITHYESLTRKDLDKIEKVANEVIKKKLKVKKELMLKDQAEKKYGFVLYQGGFIPGSEIRVVNIEGFDVQACGGTHLNNTAETGLIKILGAKRIQDGVIRLEYVCGDAAKEYVKERKQIYKESLNALNSKGKTKDEMLEPAAEVFSVRIQDLPKSLRRFTSEEKTNQELLGYSKTKVDRFFAGLGRTASTDLSKACRELFETWKAHRKEVKKLRRKR